MTQTENSQSLNSLMTTVMAETPYLPEAEVSVTIIELTDEDRNEVLAFLAERPVQTVCFIQDNFVRLGLPLRPLGRAKHQFHDRFPTCSLRV